MLETKKWSNANPIDAALPVDEQMALPSELPEHWEVITLGRLLEDKRLLVKNGYAQGTFNQQGNGVIQLRPYNVSEDGRLTLSQMKHIEAPSTTSPYWVRQGDVIFNNTNSEELVGKTAYFPLDGEYVLSNHMTILRVLDKSTLDSYWLAHAMQHLWYQGVFQALCRRHVNQASVGLERLRGVQLRLPPLREQHSIAYTLRVLKDGIGIRHRELALERERKAALMEHLFSFGRADTAIAQTVTLFGAVPGHWQIMPLEQVAHVQTGVAKGRRLEGKERVTLPYLRVANVQDGYLDLSEMRGIELLATEAAKYALQEGDVVLTEGGDFDKLGRGFIWRGQVSNCVHQNHVFAVRVNRQVLLPEFLAYLAQSSYGKGYFLSVAHRTTNLASINSTKLKALPVLVPPLDEQRDIADVLGRCDTKIDSLAQEITLLCLSTEKPARVIAETPTTAPSFSLCPQPAACRRRLSLNR